ncbi:MAG: D-glycero-beta-D-manno-heptose-7-phosphate kinase [Nitrospinae bacterium]|nr:D-glycero-beta-D-manno-heptose-7-phosphate kinase [Nitrospinota bacterium]
MKNKKVRKAAKNNGETIRQEPMGAELYRRLEEMRPIRVIVTGDLILDEYLGGDISRISPEAPVGVLDCTTTEYKLGGASNVAANFRKLNCEVALIGVTGRDADGKKLRAVLKENGISAKNLVESSERPTIKKTRVMAQRQQLLRIDREKRIPVPADIEKKALAVFQRELAKADGVVISDYDKGFLTDSMLKGMITAAKKAKKPVVVDPKGNSFAKYAGADVITPNKGELEKAAGMRCVTRALVEKAARKLIKNHSIKSVLATLSADGMALFQTGEEGRFFPALAREIFDVTGAGDTVVAVFTASWLGGFLQTEAVPLANHSAGLQVAHLGAAGVGLAEIRHSLALEAGLGESKIVDLATAGRIAENLRKNGKKIVFTNGCFDLIHYGHIQYLQKARRLGDRLFLGLNSDSSVRGLKGPTRPILNEHDRAHILAALDCVDQVVLFSESTPLKLINAVKPNYLVKGGDYKAEQIVGHKEIQKWGGEIRTITYIEGNSTTGIIKKIIRSPGGG